MEINPCEICGEIPTLDKSYSARKISHKCCDINTGWTNRTDAIEKWNVLSEGIGTTTKTHQDLEKFNQISKIIQGLGDDSTKVLKCKDILSRR